MARRARLDAPHVAHHVMLHAHGDGRLFHDVDDHQDFVDRLARLLPASDAHCYAWALMPNHVHLVVQTDAGDLSRIMRRLNTGYAIRFNRVHGRRGYVYQDRFRSRIVSGDADLTGLVRYVHLNPLKGGLVDSLDALERFPWAGHGALLGSRPPLNFEAVDAALSLFGDEPKLARRRLLAWMARAPHARDEPITAHPVAPKLAPPAPAEPAGRVGLGALLRAACERYELSEEELRSGSKQHRIARARAVVAWVGVVQLRITGRSIAAALGVTPPAVSVALERGRKAALEDGFRPTQENLNIRKI
jgi:REP element-mobilizing transposase RayT